MSRARSRSPAGLTSQSDQSLDASHRPRSLRRTGPCPADDDPVGGAQQADEGPIGLPLGATARGQVPLGDAVARRLQDHASRRHGIDGQAERLGAGLVDRRGDRAAEAQDMAPGLRDHDLGPGSHPASIAIGQDSPSSVAPISLAKETGTSHEKGPRPCATSSNSALHEDVLCADAA